MGPCRRKRGTCKKKKKWALITGEKGKGRFYKIIEAHVKEKKTLFCGRGTFYNVIGALFTMVKGHFSCVKGALLGYFKKWGGGTVTPAPPPPKRRL